MKQADERILRELKGISASNAAAVSNSDGSNWGGFLKVAGGQVDGTPGKIITQRFPIDQILLHCPLTTDTPKLTALYLPQQKLITGIRWYQSTQGVYVPAAANQVGLYSYTVGSPIITRRAVCADVPTLWSQFIGRAWGFQNFTTPYLAPAGIYYAAFISRVASVTTPPTLGGRGILHGEECGNGFFADSFFNLNTTFFDTSLAATYDLTLGTPNIQPYPWCALY